MTSTPNQKIYLTLLLLALALWACVRVDLSAPPVSAVIVPTPAPPAATVTPWPTPTPIVIQMVAGPIIEPACLLPDVGSGQSITASGSYTETERSASTPMVCHITRDSCAYNQLVGILDPSIVFKEEEEAPYNTEDILMHPAMLGRPWCSMFRAKSSRNCRFCSMCHVPSSRCRSVKSTVPAYIVLFVQSRPNKENLLTVG